MPNVRHICVLISSLMSETTILILISPYQAPKWHIRQLSRHKSPGPTLHCFWHPSGFFYRTKLSWYVQDNFLMKLNNYRSAFLFKFIFHLWFWRLLLDRRESNHRKELFKSYKMRSTAIFFFFVLKVTAFQKYTTVWWLLDLEHSDLFS